MSTWLCLTNIQFATVLIMLDYPGLSRRDLASARGVGHKTVDEVCGALRHKGWFQWEARQHRTAIVPHSHMPTGLPIELTGATGTRFVLAAVKRPRCG